MPLKTSEIVDEPTLNLTSMIDIVFLLIIFFMVGSQFTERETQYDINLPTVSNAQPLTSLPDEMVINLKGDGTILVGRQKRTMTELEEELVAAKLNYADQAVVIRGEGAGPYQHVMDILSACHRAKIVHISLANRKNREDE